MKKILHLPALVIRKYHLMIRSARRTRKKIFLIAFPILILFGPFVAIMLSLGDNALAGWYNASWSYRKNITINANNVTANTISVGVNSSSDDAEECLNDNSVNLTSTDIEIIEDSFDCTGGDQEVGMRFTNIEIPQGTTITNAYVQFAVDEFHSGSTSTTVYGEDADDASTFTTTASNITGRTKTTASVAWNDIPEWQAPGGTAGEDQRTPDISSIIQEIIDRGGWSSGNDIAIILSGGSGVRVAESYDGDNPSAAPILHVEYVLEDFPVLIQITDSELSKFAQSDGDDILFTDSDNNKLDHEIESYDNATGTLTAWVEFPELSPSQNTEIYMYYGNSAASNQENAAGTWNSNYLGVYHMNEDSGTTLTDSATSASTDNATKEAAAQPNPSTGKIDGAQDFTAPDYATVTGLMGSPTDVTVQAWVNVDSNDSSGANVVSIGDVVILDAAIASENNEVTAYFHHTSGWNGTLTDTDIRGTGWRHLTYTFDDSRDEQLLYIDGTEASTGGNSYSQSIDYTGQGSNTEIGRHANASTAYDFDGDIDEVRILAAPLSEGWIATEYANQNSPSTFYSVGPQEDQNTPTLFMKFNEGYGTTTKDSVNSYTGTISGATWTVGIDNQALQFDGSNDYVTVPDNNNLDITGAMTISAWIRANSFGVSDDENRIVYKGTGSHSGNLYTLDIKDGQLNFVIDEANPDDCSGDENKCARGSTALSTSQWYHVTGTYDGDKTIKVYVNGVEDGSYTLASAPTLSANSSALHIGGRSDSAQDVFDGIIDNVKIYSHLLTAEQIKADYNSGAAVLGARSRDKLSDGLVGYWKMDEDSWSGSINEVIDSSGNDLHITSGNGAAISIGKFSNGGSFDGTNDVIGRADSALLDIDSDDSKTLSIWVKRIGNDEFNNPQILIDKQNIAEGFKFQIGSASTCAASGTNNGHICFVMSDGTNTYRITSSGTTIVADSQWHHVALVLDRANEANSVIYIDGKAQPVTRTGTLASVDASTTSVFCIGGNSAGTTCNDAQTINGVLDEARVYNRALSAGEISQLYSFAPGPTHYWNFEEGTGTTANDKSGNGKSGTLTGGVQYGVGKVGKAAVFDQTDDHIIVSSPELPTQDFTYMGWVNIPDAGTSQYIFSSIESGSSALEFTVRAMSTERVEVKINGANAPAMTTNSIPPNTWTHLAITRQNGHVTVFFNGVPDPTTGSENSTLDFGTCSFLLGVRATGSGSNCTASQGNPMGGKMDEVKIYNYARSRQQIIEDMNSGHPVGGSPVGSQTGYWKFDEGASTIAYNSGNAGLPLYGSISGASWSTSGKVNKALDFDGTDDVVTISNADEIDFDSGLATGSAFTAWVYVDSDGENNVGQIFQKGTNSYLRVSNESGSTVQLDASLDLETTDATVSVSDTLSLSTWHHVAMVYNDDSDDEVEVYIDGKLAGTSTNGVGSPASGDSNNLLIGGTTTANFDGKIDEFKVYSSALSSNQVQLDYSAGKSIQLGVLGTDASGNPSNSADRSFCPPGDTTANCGPVGEWNFEETGGSARDTSGNNNSGSLTNNPKQGVQGKIGKAYNFVKSSNQRVTVADDPVLRPGNGSWTWMLWTRPASGNITNGVLSKVSGTGEGYTMYICSSGSCASDGQLFHAAFAESVSSYRVFSSTTAVTDGKWHHFAVVADKDDDTLYVYMDGKRLNGNVSSVGAWPTIDNTDDLYIGHHPLYGGFFNGPLDQVKMYNYARTPAQIAWDYNQGKPIAHWKFDECSGSSAYDSSGNNNHGTVTPGASGTTDIGSCGSSGTSMRYLGRSGKRNYSLDYDATDDYVTVPGSASLDNIPVITVSAWIYPESAGEASFGRVLAKGASDNWWYIAIESNARLQFQQGFTTNNGGWQTDTGAISYNTWTHIAVTYDRTDTSNNAQIYINGIPVTTTEYSAPSGTFDDDADEPIIIGNRGDGARTFDGLIDDLRIYNYVLTEHQVKNVMNDGAIRWGPLTGSP